MQEQCTRTVLGGFWCRESVGSRASTRKRSNRGDRFLPLILSSPTVTCKANLNTQQAIDFNFCFRSAFNFFVFSDLFLLQIIFSPGQFVRGSIFFSSASGARSGGAAKGSRLWLLLLLSVRRLKPQWRWACCRSSGGGTDRSGSGGVAVDG